MNSVKVKIVLFHELYMARMFLNNPHTPQWRQGATACASGLINLLSRSSALAVQMLRDLMSENLGSHLFSALLFVVLVSQSFIGQVGFVSNIGFGLEKVARPYSFLFTKFLSGFVGLVG